MCCSQMPPCLPTDIFTGVALSSSGLALGLVPTQLNISSVTLHRFLEHLKNQFTHFGYEEKGCHTGHTGPGLVRVVPSLWELLMGHTLQAPSPTPASPTLCRILPPATSAPAQSSSFLLLTLPTSVLELFLLQVQIGAPVPWVAIQTGQGTVDCPGGGRPLPKPGPAPPAVSPLPQGQVSLPSMSGQTHLLLSFTEYIPVPE